MKLNDLDKFAKGFGTTEKMPAFFFGHGSPMNAIEENEFTKSWQEIGKALPKANAILFVSAHWETRGTFVTAMEKPKTIHDFGGFPERLYQVQYPAKGSPQLADVIINTVENEKVKPDFNWGLDHGTWSITKHLLPNAEIPVLQLSLDVNMSAEEHYKLGKQLVLLRQKGIIIAGSGNIVHNLRLLNWHKLNDPGFSYEWAEEVDSKVKEIIAGGNHNDLFDIAGKNEAFKLAIPTPEHFLPLLYVLAVQDEKDGISYFNDKGVGGSLTMTSLMLK